MAYDTFFADRVRELIAAKEQQVEEKKMFGGLCFMVNDKMCVGVRVDTLMVRLNPEMYEEVIEKEGCRPMDFTGKSMKGFVYVDTAFLQTNKQLSYWINLALAYNPIANVSKKRKT